jgi:type I restriction enzyme S subunit
MEAALNKIRVNRYPAYKDSGVEWLGEIPEHWEIRKLKFVVEFVNGATPKTDNLDFWDGNIVWITPNDLGKLNSKYVYDSLKKISILGLENCSASISPIDSVVISSRAPIGHLGILKIPAAINQGCKILIPKSKIIWSSYIFYYLISTRQILNSIGSGSTFNELSTQSLKDFNIIYPEYSEQIRISEFLDNKTAQIDKAIAQKERVIELLKEKRQILIQRAVTRGLNPNVKMKDSGVEWIGEIPEHWEVKRLKDICSINLDSLHETTRSDFSFKYVDISSVTYETGIFQTEEYTFKNAPSRARRIARKGDTIISTVRTYLKAIDYINEEKSISIYSTGFAVLHPKELIHSEFLATFVKSNAFTEQVIVNSKGMSYPAINSSELGRLYIVHGNIDEQQAIVKYINERSSRIFNYISIKEIEIEKLKEYKATLINSAVTGKIKV